MFFCSATAENIHSPGNRIRYLDHTVQYNAIQWDHITLQYDTYPTTRHLITSQYNHVITLHYNYSTITSQHSTLHVIFAIQMVMASTCPLFLEQFKGAIANGPLLDSHWKCRYCGQLAAVHRASAEQQIKRIESPPSVDWSD